MLRGTRLDEVATTETVLDASAAGTREEGVVGCAVCAGADRRGCSGGSVRPEGVLDWVLCGRVLPAECSKVACWIMWSIWRSECSEARNWLWLQECSLVVSAVVGVA